MRGGDRAGAAARISARHRQPPNVRLDGRGEPAPPRTAGRPGRPAGAAAVPADRRPGYCLHEPTAGATAELPGCWERSRKSAPRPRCNWTVLTSCTSTTIRKTSWWTPRGWSPASSTGTGQAAATASSTCIRCGSILPVVRRSSDGSWARYWITPCPMRWRGPGPRPWPARCRISYRVPQEKGVWRAIAVTYR